MFMTKPPRRGYIVSDWMTVRMSSIGRGLCSISCCITTASTSDVYTFFSPKHRFVAMGLWNKNRERRPDGLFKQEQNLLLWILLTFESGYLWWWTSCHTWWNRCYGVRWGARQESEETRRNYLHLKKYTHCYSKVIRELYIIENLKLSVLSVISLWLNRFVGALLVITIVVLRMQVGSVVWPI